MSEITFLSSEPSLINWLLNHVNNWTKSQNSTSSILATRTVTLVSGSAFAALSATYNALAFTAKAPFVLLRYAIFIPIPVHGQWRSIGGCVFSNKGFELTEMLKHAYKTAMFTIDIALCPVVGFISPIANIKIHELYRLIVIDSPQINLRNRHPIKPLNQIKTHVVKKRDISQNNLKPKSSNSRDTSSNSQGPFSLYQELLQLERERLALKKEKKTKAVSLDKKSLDSISVIENSKIKNFNAKVSPSAKMDVPTKEKNLSALSLQIENFSPIYEYQLPNLTPFYGKDASLYYSNANIYYEYAPSCRIHNPLNNPPRSPADAVGAKVDHTFQSIEPKSSPVVEPRRLPPTPQIRNKIVQQTLPTNSAKYIEDSREQQSKHSFLIKDCFPHSGHALSDNALSLNTPTQPPKDSLSGIVKIESINPIPMQKATNLRAPPPPPPPLAKKIIVKKQTGNPHENLRKEAVENISLLDKLAASFITHSPHLISLETNTDCNTCNDTEWDDNEQNTSLTNSKPLNSITLGTAAPFSPMPQVPTNSSQQPKVSNKIDVKENCQENIAAYYNSVSNAVNRRREAFLEPSADEWSDSEDE